MTILFLEAEGAPEHPWPTELLSCSRDMEKACRAHSAGEGKLQDTQLIKPCKSKRKWAGLPIPSNAQLCMNRILVRATA